MQANNYVIRNTLRGGYLGNYPAFSKLGSDQWRDSAHTIICSIRGVHAVCRHSNPLSCPIFCIVRTYLLKISICLCGKLKHTLPLTCYVSTTMSLHPHILWSDNGLFPAEIKFAQCS